ncbi:MAG: hypothetical protein AUG51_25165 [Acidobacteria bacterium 13_1_20CM_3_53_8]|nr:MAG: hypothetical protein AUG51_25165 [Acidobacteria bacterium 13_1_20CM_3_53_8]
MTPALALSLAKGYVMIKTLDIKNFRCFEKVHIPNLKRINVIVGTNASGKTALLEAIYLAGGAQPDLNFKLRTWRGLGGAIRISTDLASHHDLWKDLFHKFDETKPPTISFRGTSAFTRTLTIFFSPSKERVIPVNSTQEGTQATVPLVFQWTKGTKTIGVSRIEVVNGEFKISGAGIPIGASFYTSAQAIEPLSTADRFSNLKKRGKEMPVVDFIKNMFSFIDRVDVDTHHGLPMLHAYIKSLPEAIPLGFVSAGINKLVAILVDVINFGHGIVLLDEVENGFYYETMPEIWMHLFKLSSDNGTQIFASTHSLEALRNILPAIKGHEEDFCLLRTKMENGKCIVRRIEGADFEAAIEEGVEVR